MKNIAIAIAKTLLGLIIAPWYAIYYLTRGLYKLGNGVAHSFVAGMNASKKERQEGTTQDRRVKPVCCIRFAEDPLEWSGYLEDGRTFSVRFVRNWIEFNASRDVTTNIAEARTGQILFSFEIKDRSTLETQEMVQFTEKLVNWSSCQFTEYDSKTQAEEKTA